MNAVPGVLQVHREEKGPVTSLAKQWEAFFDTGKKQGPMVAVAVASSFSYLAWSARSSAHLFGPAARTASLLYGGAAIMTIGIIPYTLAFMNKTNLALKAVANSTPTPNKPSVSSVECERLMEKWQMLNGFRSMLPLGGAIIGVFAAFIWTCRRDFYNMSE